ncbi:hypothetical protein QBC40DRAFT_203115 [Triangularia verruculosa]|uniref:Uncharacterized protein n=1 Tax=Triangularia verruculosa TaxID=2587418 RepID=A0AAN7AVS2_9PEZI|nr:hypothetical protein QBC40DRAFT_203115 [Triangularia verruculosa]
MKPGRLLLSIAVGVITGVDVVATAQFVTAVRGGAVGRALPPRNARHERVEHLDPRQDREAEAERRTTVIARTITTTRVASRTSPSTTQNDDNKSTSTIRSDDTRTTSTSELSPTAEATDSTTSPSASASATGSPLPPPSEEGGLSPGTAAGIAAGAVAGVAIIGLIAFLLWRRKKGGIRGAVVTADYPDTMNMVDAKGNQYPEPTLPNLDGSGRNGSLTNDPFFPGAKDEFGFVPAGGMARRQSSFSPSQVGMAMTSPGQQQQYGAYQPPPQDEQQFVFVGQQMVSPGQQQQQQFDFTQASPGQPQQQFAYAPAQAHLAANQQYYQQQQQQFGGDVNASSAVPYRPVSAVTAYPSPGHPILPVSPLTPHRQSIGMGSQPSPYYPPHPSQPPHPPQGAENVVSPNLPNFMIPGGNRTRAMSFSAATAQYEGGGSVGGEGVAFPPPPPVPTMPAAVALTSSPLSPLRRNPIQGM